MYKNTHDNHDFIKRSGNHSTKGSRRGFADIGFVDPEDLHDSEYEIRKRLSAKRADAIEQRERLERILFPRGSNLKTWRHKAKKYKGSAYLFRGGKFINELVEYWRLGDIVHDCGMHLARLGCRRAEKDRFVNILIERLKSEVGQDRYNEISQAAWRETNIRGAK